jgi:hypothetical protein
MSYTLQGPAQHLQPRREERLKRPEASGLRPEAGRSTISSRAGDSRSKIVAAWSTRRRPDGPRRRGSRHSSDSGVSPIASGASRGIALFVSR